MIVWTLDVDQYTIWWRLLHFILEKSSIQLEQLRVIISYSLLMTGDVFLMD